MLACLRGSRGRTRPVKNSRSIPRKLRKRPIMWLLYALVVVHREGERDSGSPARGIGERDENKAAIARSCCGCANQEIWHIVPD
jgi:hypothetical protein